MRLEITSAILRSPDEKGALHNLHECESAARDAGFDFGIQLHNSATERETQLAVDSGLLTSVHAPVCGGFLLNLTMADSSFVMELFAQNAAAMHNFGVSEAVFHGFSMTDAPIPAFGRGRSYDQCMRALLREEFSLFPGGIHCSDFSGTAEFRERHARVKERLALLEELFPDLTFCLENDFPAYSSANIFPEEICTLDHPQCLDSSHLWAGALLFDHDFLADARLLLESGNVKMIHLHASAMKHSTPKKELWDGHLPLATPNEMKLPILVKMAKEAGVGLFVLEIFNATSADVRDFAALYHAG